MHLPVLSISIPTVRPLLCRMIDPKLWHDKILCNRNRHYPSLQSLSLRCLLIKILDSRQNRELRETIQTENQRKVTGNHLSIIPRHHDVDQIEKRSIQLFHPMIQINLAIVTQFPALHCIFWAVKSDHLPPCPDNFPPGSPLQWSHQVLPS